VHIFVVGVDYTSAPIDVRERLSFAARQIPAVLQAACEEASEAVLLSTCNRMELYAVGNDIEHLYKVLTSARSFSLNSLRQYSFELRDEQAVSHLLGVACGLHSLVPGEAQIQGQVVDALEIAQACGSAGPITSSLFRTAIRTGKRARSETGISRNAASISHVAVKLARQLFPRLNESSVLLVGSGKMSELAAQNLCENGASRLVIINRTQTHAVQLAEKYGATYRTFAELANALVEADVVITSTTAPRALITQDLMERVMAQRNGRSLLLIDIALPRDVEPEVTNIPGIYLFNLDDLQASVDEGIRLRMQEIEQVQAIIKEEAEEFQRWLKSLSVVGTISHLREHADGLRQQELERAMRQLAPTLSEREAAIVQELTTRLVNKLLHTPMARLKQAAAEGQGHIYAEALRYLFDLEVQDEAYNSRNASQQTGDDSDSTGDRPSEPAVAWPYSTY
jgi:glutamyl-tRNA reductase